MSGLVVNSYAQAVAGPTVPDAPSDLNGSYAHVSTTTTWGTNWFDQYTLTWSPPSDGGSTILDYRVYYKEYSGGTWGGTWLYYSFWSSSPAVITVPDATGYYKFVITARNAIGESAYSNEWNPSGL